MIGENEVMCECAFCDKQQIITDFVYEDEFVMAFMDMDPINEWHILLVPKQHYLDVDEIPDELLAHLMIVSKKIVTAFFPRYMEDGFGWTYGSEEKAVNSEIAERIRKQLQA